MGHSKKGRRLSSWKRSNKKGWKQRRQLVASNDGSLWSNEENVPLATVVESSADPGEQTIGEACGDSEVNEEATRSPQIIDGTEVRKERDSIFYDDFGASESMNAVHLDVIENNGDSNLNVGNNGSVFDLHLIDGDDVAPDKASIDVDRNPETIIEGRRVVDFNFLWKEIHRTFDDHAQVTGCLFRDWELTNSRRQGFITQFFFHCKNCNHHDNIWSEPIEKEIPDINSGATIGTLTTGIGYAQLEELTAAMNVPCISEKTYIKYRETLIDSLLETALIEMKAAGEEEKELAIKRGDVHDGIPYISVVVDGSWMKRSYGTNYDSLSGVGAIIGYNTRKVLFVGVRNKFCTVCDIAQRAGTEAKVHKCYKNFDRNASSTSMESDAIVEGFKSSLEMHGLIYKMVVADGDSNVYKSIRDNDPYRDQGLQVKKIECTNHLLRNLCKKIKATSEITQPKGQRKSGFITARNAVKGKIMAIRKEVVKAATRWREVQQPHHCRVKGLQNEILNVCSHVFGEHKRCVHNNCLDNKPLGEKNIVPNLKAHGLYQKVGAALEYISCYSDSLLFNLTNNVAESFNAIICKDIGGKRINFGLRGSYTGRVAGAVVQYNTQQVLTKYHENVYKNIPPIVKRLEKRRQKKIASAKEMRASNGRKRRVSHPQGLDKNYGPNSEKPDVEPGVYEQLRENHLQKLSENAKNWERIECDTRDQSQSELWMTLRKQMLTASNFGVVCRMRPTTSCGAKVKEILYPPISDAVALNYGHDNESKARTELEIELKKEIKTCGLFIDKEFPFLGASPDGLIDEDGLVEIKCPLTAKDFTQQEAVEALAQMKGVFDKKNPCMMNRKHRYFYQVQGQLHVTRRDYCIFAAWAPNHLKWIKVYRDDAFWDNHMSYFLIRFYQECMLPEILDSRFNRRMPIRNPEYITKAIADAALKADGKTSKKRNSVSNSGQQGRPQKRRVLEGAVIMEKSDCSSASLQKGEKSATEPAETEAFILQQTEDESVTVQIAQVDDFAPKKIRAPKKTAKTDILTAAAVSDDEDCIVVSYRKGEGFTPDEAKEFRRTLDNEIHCIEVIRNNVLPVRNHLNEQAVDSFLRIVREKYGFETQSVQYMYSHATLIEPVQSKRSIQIIGGKATNHWRCIYFDATRIRVYDSLPSLTNYRLVDLEKQYIRRRYPTIREIDITFMKVQQQPVGVSCGIYASAFATSVIFGRDPSKETYSTNEALMRCHFLRILEDKSLSLFPR